MKTTCLKQLQLLLLLLLSSFLTFTAADYVAESILCDDIPAICEQNHLSDDRNNDTLCGDKERFLNPHICNCGHKCMGTMEEGQSCPTSSVMLYPTEFCGFQLECISDEVAGTNAKCIYNTDKECISQMLEYDSTVKTGDVGPGSYRPNCNDDGTYAGRQCSPGSTCYCVDENNQRLFGEAPSTLFDEMDCACAIYWQDTEKRGLNEGLRCLTNGNFDPLYCVDDVCFCYYQAQDKTDGPYPANMATELPCYDSQIHNPNYTNPCTKDQQEWDKRRGNTTIVIDDSKRPNCSRDGYYNPVRRMGSSAYCVDPYGEVIENFTAPLYEVDRLTCHCARRRYIMEENGLGSFKPRCCPNGDYYTYQTRGLLAYCVDDNGNQLGEAVPITNIEALFCDYSNPCPVYDPFSSY